MAADDPHGPEVTGPEATTPPETDAQPSTNGTGAAAPQGTPEYAWPEADMEAEAPVTEPAVAQAAEKATTDTTSPAPRRGRWIAAAVGAVGLLYLLDLVLSTGEVPRDVVVAGVDLGGLDRSSAQAKLEESLGPRLAAPAQVVTDGHTATVDPVAARIELDWNATLDKATERTVNPFERLKSLFVDREIAPVMRGDAGRIGAALAPLSKQIDRAPQEGGIWFEGATPVAIEPRSGRKLDIDRATRTVIDRWAWGAPIELTPTELGVKATPEGVGTALEEFARPATSGPVTLRAHGLDVPLSPGAIANVLTFEPNDHGGLTPHLPIAPMKKVLGKRLAPTEAEATDARFTFGKTKARIKPAVDGREVDWGATSGKLLAVLPLRDRRVLEVAYAHTPAELTGSQLKKLGIREVIGEFTTRDFADDSGINIRTVAKKVNGAIVRPGASFSLNGFTGRRGVKQGYVGAAVIENGELSRAVGGGISQFATTLYNASYFAGMVDVEHQEHSFYISRYPVAREATVFQNPNGSSVIDLRFRNEAETGVAIQTVWTPSSITVRLWGTKGVKVESITGDKRDFTGIPVKTIPWGQECTPSSGTAGFTASDTKVIRDLKGTELSRKARTVTYRPLAAVTCAPKPEPKPSEEPAKPKPSPKPSSAPPPGTAAPQSPIGDVVRPGR